MRALLLQTLTPLAATLLLLFAIVQLGEQAGRALEPRTRYAIAFLDLECDPPAPLGRTEFLREVQYEADAPDILSRLDAHTPNRLRDCFLKHPWVERVEGVELRPRGEVRVRLTYRAPVLAIRAPERLYAVSADGVVLPRAAETNGLPLLREARLRPFRAGTRSVDADILAAARTAALLKEQPERVDLSSLEFLNGELILWTPTGCRIVWGQPPLQERGTEPGAALKCERLLMSLTAVRELSLPVEIDLRPEAGAARRLLVADSTDAAR